MLNTSETIRDLEVPDGRRLLHDFFHDRRPKHRLEINTMLDCWRLCRHARDIQFSDGRRVRFETNLGFKVGTRVFFEEIIGVYYYNSILGAVYFGAMVVLVAVGLYLSGFPLWVALAGFAVQALLLLMLSIVTAYTRPDEVSGPTHGLALPENALLSLNGTVREMTNAVSDLFRLMSQSDLRQDVLLTRLTEYMGKSNAEHARMQAERLDETNHLLREAVTTMRTVILASREGALDDDARHEQPDSSAGAAGMSSTKGTPGAAETSITGGSGAAGMSGAAGVSGAAGMSGAAGLAQPESTGH